MIYDDVARHLAAAGSFERAAVPLGMYLAWCANHQLLSADFAERTATLVLRVRYREATGSELAVAGGGGVLSADHLNTEGRAFTEHYYPTYLTEFSEEFGLQPYAVEDNWSHYDRMARRLTKALMRFRNGGHTEDDSRHRSWWRFWR